MEGQRFKHILSSSPAIIYTCRVDGDYDLTFVSGNVLSHFGYTPAECLRKKDFWREIIHPDDHSHVFDGCDNFFATGHEAHEYRLLKKDGSYLWVYDEMRLVLDDAGNPIEIVGSWLDISSRKKTEAALNKSENLFRNFFQTNPVPTIISSADGMIHMANPAFLESGGFTEDQVVGRTLQEMGFWRVPEDRERMDAAIRECGYIDNLESVFYDREGRERVCQVSSRAIEYGSELRILNSIVDVTEKRKAEEDLRLSEKLFRTFFQANPVPTIISDIDGTVHMINPAFTLNPGYTSEEVVGRKVHDLGFWQIPEDRDRMIAALKGQGYVDNLESRFHGKGKRPMTCLISSRIVDFEGSKKIISIVDDVTELRKAEVAMKKIEQAKSDFISTAAHELRTPLIAVIGYCELLENAVEMNFSDKQKEEYLGIIQSNAELLNRLVDDLLDIGRIQIGRPLGISRRETDLVPFVERVVASSKLKSGRHEIVIVKGDSVPQKVWVDSGRITQVLHNLLSNAIKYSPAGGVVKLLINGRDDSVDVSVVDQGIGMSTEQIEHIFDRFYRVDTDSSQSLGLGLGMSIVKQIIVDHGGEILVESSIGKGTTVTFSLPVRACAC